MVIVYIGWVILGVVILGFYNGYMLLDDKTQEQTDLDKDIEAKWHLMGAIFTMYLALSAWYILGLKYVPLVFSSFWLWFAGIVHIIGMKKSFFYVGTFAWSDRMLRRMFKKPEVWVGIIKIIAFISSIILIIN